jgi:hypothetical protein
MIKKIKRARKFIAYVSALIVFILLFSAADNSYSQVKTSNPAPNAGSANTNVPGQVQGNPLGTGAVPSKGKSPFLPNIPIPTKKKVNIYKPLKIKKVSPRSSTYKKFLNFFKDNWSKTKLAQNGREFREPLPLYDMEVECGSDKLYLLDFYDIEISGFEEKKKISKGAEPEYAVVFKKGAGLKKEGDENRFYSVYRYIRQDNLFFRVFRGRVKRLIGTKRIAGTPFDNCPDILFEEVDSDIKTYLTYEFGEYHYK